MTLFLALALSFHSTHEYWIESNSPLAVNSLPLLLQSPPPLITSRIIPPILKHHPRSGQLPRMIAKEILPQRILRVTNPLRLEFVRMLVRTNGTGESRWRWNVLYDLVPDRGCGYAGGFEGEVCGCENALGAQVVAAHCGLDVLDVLFSGRVGLLDDLGVYKSNLRTSSLSSLNGRRGHVRMSGQRLNLFSYESAINWLSVN